MKNVILIKKLPIVLKGAMLDTSGKWSKLKDVKKGDYVRRKAESLTTYKKGDYDKATKTYNLIDCEDTSREIFLSGQTLVFIDFTY